MKIKIISDGTALGTKVINSETGEPIGWVQDITWHVGVNDAVADCTVKLVMVPVELEVSANLEKVEADSATRYPENVVTTIKEIANYQSAEKV